MGKLSPTGIELAQVVVSGSLTATGSSGAGVIGGEGPNAGGATAATFKDTFNAQLSGTFVATMQLQRSTDGGTTYIPLSVDNAGNANSYTAPMSLPCFEPEAGVLYRWTCTAFTSGTINYRISQ